MKGKNGEGTGGSGGEEGGEGFNYYHFVEANMMLILRDCLFYFYQVCCLWNFSLFCFD